MNGVGMMMGIVKLEVDVNMEDVIEIFKDGDLEEEDLDMFS